MTGARLSNALEGVRVVDFSQSAAGPVCTLMLADMGAEVIKVEPPAGDFGRQFLPLVAGESVNFMALNGGKRSVVLDLKTPQGVARAKALCAGADVVVESFRPGVMERLGLGYQAVSAERPQIVYASISAYGQDGKFRGRPGVDGILQAAGGLMSQLGHDEGAPAKVPTPVADMTTGHHACIAILGALQRRGQGIHLDISMFACMVALQQLAFAGQFAGVSPRPSGSAAPYAAPNEALRCADGWIMVAAYQPDRWEVFCGVLGLEHLPRDARFASGAGRLQHRAALAAALEAVLVSRPVAQWLAVLQASDILCAPIRSVGQVIASEEFAHSALHYACQHPRAGMVEGIGSALRARGEVRRARAPAPLLGQHTDQVLGELPAAAEQAG